MGHPGTASRTAFAPRVRKAMSRSPATMLLLLLLATPAQSQSLDGGVIPTDYDLARLPAQPQLTHKEPIIVPQLMDRFEPNGARVRQRGIIIGKNLTKNVTVGIGLVDRKPRKSGYVPGLTDDGQRRSGKASVLMKLKF